MKGRRWVAALVAMATTLVAALVAATAQARTEVGQPAAQGSTYRVGIVYSRTGLLAAYGAQYIQGLRLGLRYATGGSNRVNGRRIELTLRDDAGNPATAVNHAKDLIGEGYKIIAGSTSSGVALQVAPIAAQNRVLFISGPAATDAITGINRYTFRSGRQTWQDVLAAQSYLRGAGRNVVVFTQDTAFGQGNAAAVAAVLGGRGHRISRILVPLSANDFTPFAQRVRQANPDLVFVAWAGTTAPAMWQALDQQGVFRASRVVTGLAERATYSTFGPVASRISFLSHYVSNGPRNRVNDWLVRDMRRRRQVPDLFTPDGFTAAQMIVRALRTARGDNVDRMIRALEGWRFTAPKGAMYIRPQDHGLMQPMFQVQLRRRGSGWAPRVLRRISPGNVQPPVRPFQG